MQIENEKWKKIMDEKFKNYGYEVMNQEVVLTPEEIYFIGKSIGGKYLDYDYISAMQDIEKQKGIRRQEIIRQLEQKGYAEENFFGELEFGEECLDLLRPLYQGEYEAELILREKEGGALHYKFHHWEGRILAVSCQNMDYRLRMIEKAELESLLQSLLPAESKEAEEAECISAKEAERSIILKGTHIGKDACLYFYGEKEGCFYEADLARISGKELKKLKKKTVYEQAIKILRGEWENGLSR